MSENIEKVVSRSTQEFSTERSEDDINLVEEIANLLKSIGKENDLEMYYNHEYIKVAQDKIPPVQRFFLNKYWTLQILNIEADSIDVRYCLVNTGSPETWLNMFKKKIVPFIIEHDLPHF